MSNYFTNGNCVSSNNQEALSQEVTFIAYQSSSTQCIRHSKFSNICWVEYNRRATELQARMYPRYAMTGYEIWDKFLKSSSCVSVSLSEKPQRLNYLTRKNAPYSKILCLIFFSSYSFSGVLLTTKRMTTSLDSKSQMQGFPVQKIILKMIHTLRLPSSNVPEVEKKCYRKG